jgi:hypothetical protein
MVITGDGSTGDGGDASIVGGRHWVDRRDNAPGYLWSPRLTYHAGRRSVILYGGYQSPTASAAMWELTEAGWAQLCASCPPGGRVSPQLAYDERRNLLVLYGGRDSSDNVLADHWEWDGTTWVQVFASALPGPRERGQLIYDAARSLLVLIGGGDTPEELFEYDGSAWRSAGTVPFDLSGAGTQAAYDEVGQRVFVINQGGGYTFDALWTRRSSSTTWIRECDACIGRVRSDASIVYDPASASLFLMNGYDDDESVSIAGTWQWRDGVVTAVSSLPDERDSSGVAYDAHRSVIVLYGGNGESCGGDCDETWEMIPD